MNCRQSRTRESKMKRQYKLVDAWGQVSDHRIMDKIDLKVAQSAADEYSDGALMWKPVKSGEVVSMPPSGDMLYVEAANLIKQLHEGTPIEEIEDQGRALGRKHKLEDGVIWEYLAEIEDSVA